MSRESHGNPRAKHINSDHAYPDGHSSTDYGCLQLNDYWHFGSNGWSTVGQAYDPAFNVRYALGIYRAQGWSAWYGAKGIYW